MAEPGGQELEGVRRGGRRFKERRFTETPYNLATPLIWQGGIRLRHGYGATGPATSRSWRTSAVAEALA